MPTATFLANLDYWAERYQTLFIGGCAVVAAIWAVRPAWRQVSILEAQRTDQIRERLAATYRMISKAIAALDPESWRQQVQFSRRPPEDEIKGPALRPALLAGYVARKEMWANVMSTVRAALSPEQFETISSDLAMVDDRFVECDQRLDPATVAARDLERGEDSVEYWFYAADYPDLMVLHRMNIARQELERMAGQTVEALVKP